MSNSINYKSVLLIAVTLILLTACEKAIPLKANNNKIDNDILSKSLTIEPKDSIDYQDKENDAYFIVDEMPIFMPDKCNELDSNNVKLSRWISLNFKYPAIYRELNIYGKIYIRFIVTANGSVDKVTIARGVDPLLDSEAVRLIKSMPNWKPGRHKGKNVNVWYITPIRIGYY